jgi:hypothetical protein
MSSHSEGVFDRAAGFQPASTRSQNTLVNF